MRTGRFIKQLSGVVSYNAFIPNNLPFNFKIDIALQNLLSRADQALGRLDGIAERLPDVDFFIMMYVRKEATLSSQIEGTQATFVDVLKAEAKIADMEIHNDVDEVLSYIIAMNYGLDRVKEFPLSLRLMKEIHTKLLRGVRGEWKTPGEFRTSQNWVGGSSINTATYIPPPHTEIMKLMGNLEDFLRNRSELPILLKTGLMHAQFESIHPFLDGNGRIGRLLITFYLCQQDILKKPLLYLSEFFKEYRQIYYDKLNNFRFKDEIEEWFKFYLEGVATTSIKATVTARKIIQLREKSIHEVSKFGRNAEKGLMLLHSLFRTPLIRIKDTERITKLSNPNALLLVEKFIKAGILKEITGFKRNRVFSFVDYIGLFS